MSGVCSVFKALAGFDVWFILGVLDTVNANILRMFKKIATYNTYQYSIVQSKTIIFSTQPQKENPSAPESTFFGILVLKRVVGLLRWAWCDHTLLFSETGDDVKSEQMRIRPKSECPGAAFPLY